MKGKVFIVLVLNPYINNCYSKLFGEKTLAQLDNIHLIQNGCLLDCCIVHCCIPRPQSTMDVNEFVHCCMTRPQSIVFHNASMANTRMSLSHSKYLQRYLKIRCIHGALRSEYATIRNAQCNNSEDNLF